MVEFLLWIVSMSMLVLCRLQQLRAKWLFPRFLSPWSAFLAFACSDCWVPPLNQNSCPTNVSPALPRHTLSRLQAWRFHRLHLEGAVSVDDRASHGELSLY